MTKLFSCLQGYEANWSSDRIFSSVFKNGNLSAVRKNETQSSVILNHSEIVQYPDMSKCSTLERCDNIIFETRITSMVVEVNQLDDTIEGFEGEKKVCVISYPGWSSSASSFVYKFKKGMTIREYLIDMQKQASVLNWSKEVKDSLQWSLNNLRFNLVLDHV